MTLLSEPFGRGEDIVLLHGWGMPSEVWQPLIEIMEPFYCLHRVDLPGYGGSDTVNPYTLEVITQRVADYFPLPVHVMGWSLGGLIGMQWALKRPNCIKSLTLVASSPCFMQRSDWPYATPPRDLERFATDLVTDYTDLIRRFLALQTMGSQMRLEALQQLESFVHIHTPPQAEVLLNGLAILQENDLRAQIGQIECPVLLQYGAKDRMTPVQVAEWLLAYLPNVQSTVHPRAGHLPFVSHAPDFAAAQLAFLQNL